MRGTRGTAGARRRRASSRLPAYRSGPGIAAALVAVVAVVVLGALFVMGGVAATVL